jgi:nucleotide-binding universal stress UspA family protein
MSAHLFENILVAINGTEDSIHAAMYGIIMARQFNAHLKAVYVVDTAALRHLTLTKIFTPDERDDYARSLARDGMRYLEHVADLGKQKGVTVETELLNGAMWTQVISAAQDMKANAILLGGNKTVGPTASAEGAAKSEELLTYSEIFAHSPCSIIVVKEPLIEHLFKTLR